MFTNEDFRISNLTLPLSPEMSEINIDIEGVRWLMKNLDPFKASGPDKVQSRFLKQMAEELSAGMTLMFTTSLHQAKIPNAWRDALVSPLYPENYRPILLTSVSCKMLEHIIHRSKRSKRSCETQLIKSVHDVAKSLNDGEQIDSILLDSSKAFDKVSHRKWCLKLQHYEIRG